VTRTRAMMARGPGGIPRARHGESETAKTDKLSESNSLRLVTRSLIIGVPPPAQTVKGGPCHEMIDTSHGLGEFGSRPGNLPGWARPAVGTLVAPSLY
jgi:hypothetical protein